MFKILLVIFSLAISHSSYGQTGSHDAAKDALVKGVISIGSSYVMYKALEKPCKTDGNPSTKAMFCAMAITSAGQIASDIITNRKHQDSISATGDLGISDFNSPGEVDLATSLPDGFLADATDTFGVDPTKIDPGQLIQGLKESSGLDYDPKTSSVLDQNGNPISQSRINAAAAASGITNSPGLKSLGKKVENLLEKYPVGSSIAGSKKRGSGRGYANSYSNKKKKRSYGSSLKGFNFGLGAKDAAKRDVASLTRKLAGGEAIGVAASDIFETISNRYSQESGQKLFDEKIDPKLKY